MTSRFPVITGLGLVTAAGCGVDEVWRSISSSVSGLKPLSLFQSPRYGQIPVGEIQNDLRELGAPLRGSRSDKLGWIAARQAIIDAKINLQDCGERVGIVLGCSVGGSFDSEHFLTTLIKRRKMRARPTRFHECASAIDLIADGFGLFGPGIAIATACSSGALAIATAAEMIMAGEAEVMLAGGADSLSRMTWGGFHALLLVDAAGCRPFDAKRGGMTLGEGAAILILESEEFAKRRGAKILARLSGWGASCDAHHATAPHPEGDGALAAMQSALRRAHLEPAAIDYVNAHGTGTRDNDLAEAKALKKLFAGRVPSFSSTKRIFGHALAASGAMEAAVCVEALRRQELPPSAGFSELDSAIGLEPITKIQSAPLTHVMSNSFGFGGNNAVLIFSKPETMPLTRVPEKISITVGGLGVIAPGSIVEKEIPPLLPPAEISAHSCGALDVSSLDANQRRRLNRLQQMALVAARRAISNFESSAKINPTGRAELKTSVAIGTGMGCLDSAALFIENLIAKDEREPMPAQFPNSVHNAAAAQIAIDQNARGLNSAPTVSEISFESALWQGISQLANGEADFALAGAVDELNKYVLGIGARWKIWNEKILPGEGAVVASLARAEKTAAPLARIAAVKLGRWRKPFDAKRETDWIAANVDLKNVGVILSGAKGLPQLDEKYETVAAELSKRAKRNLEHQTYKQICGEFHAASAFGFSVAVKLAREKNCGVILYTLSPRGAKALCLIEP
ncbi:MAG TPA: beta-ketoacyl-[acyl-carrier-protein] synthase family protein [Verrucomicrobiae bacterium]|nr:beta-ketoacyl-[acyl-carrier-protein] synthase family protein [Verrucomicrobiae bacterium]